MTHTSDCGLHNAPAMKPTICTCGASHPFKVFEYRVAHDAFGWEEYSREGLVATIGSRALIRCVGVGTIGRPRATKLSRLVERACMDSFTPGELATISDMWAAAWLPLEDGAMDRHGIVDVVCELDGSPLPAELRAQLALPPDEAEVKACLAPWIEFWRTQP